MKPPGILGPFLLAASLLSATPARAANTPVYVVIFTHVEDNTPSGLIGSAQSRQSYQNTRSNLIAMAGLAESSGVQWTLQPDWKILEAALAYEDSAMRATTNGKNFLRYLREDRGVVIDPHSHENGGYNYTDVAHLLDSLGVGGSTVIGGHVWDPTIPEFAEWDRFRVPVPGQRYPGAIWRGDILIGSGTPDHVNDPVLSGLWRPRDRDHYFDDDPAANIVAVGQWKRSIASIAELIDLYRSGDVSPTAMLTFTFNVPPNTLSGPNGLASVADTVIAPLEAWSDSGLIETTDFTSLVRTWETSFGAQSFLYPRDAQVLDVSEADLPPAMLTLGPAVPNPIRSGTWIRYSLGREAQVRLSIFDVLGRRVTVLAEGPHAAGAHAAWWDASRFPDGAYVCRLEAVGSHLEGGSAAQSRMLFVVR